MTDASPGPSDISAVAMDLLEFAREHASPALPVPYLWSTRVVKETQGDPRICLMLSTWHGEPGRAKVYQQAVEHTRERITGAIDCGVGNDVLLRSMKAMVEGMMLALIKLGDRK